MSKSQSYSQESLFQDFWVRGGGGEGGLHAFVHTNTWNMILITYGLLHAVLFTIISTSINNAAELS